MIWKILGGVIIIALVVGGFFYWRSSQTAAPDTMEVETTETTMEEEPTPTEAEVDKGEFSIEIQNGSGIEGEAGRAQELLEGEDFTVTGTANADSYDYEETVIRASADVSEEWLDMLIEALETNYTVDSSIEDLEDSDADVVVVVGSFDDSGESMVEEVEEETTDPTPTVSEDSEETPTDTPTPSPTP